MKLHPYLDIAPEAVSYTHLGPEAAFNAMDKVYQKMEYNVEQNFRCRRLIIRR